MVKKTTTNDIANLFNRSLRMDVAKIDCTITQVIDTTCRSSYGGRSNGLLSESVGDEITISTVQYVSISRSDA